MDKRPDKPPHFSQASQDHQTAKHYFQNAFKKNPIFVQIDEKVTQTFESVCKKVAARTKPWKVATKSQVYQEKPTKSRRSKGKCNLGTSGMSRSVEFMLVAKWLNAFFCEVLCVQVATSHALDELQLYCGSSESGGSSRLPQGTGECTSNSVLRSS